MPKLYKNYIIWTGDNPRLLDIVLSPYNPSEGLYTENASCWWEDIRYWYANKIVGGNDIYCLVSGEEDYIADLRANGVFPSP